MKLKKKEKKVKFESCLDQTLNFFNNLFKMF